MRTFTELEVAVLTKLLAGNHPVLAQLRFQLGRCRVEKREFTGAGFFTTLAVTDDVHRVDDRDLRFGDVLAEIEGMAHGAGFLLYVEHGQLAMLEAYSYDETWPDTIRDFTLAYAGGEARDWEKLEQVLGP